MKSLSIETKRELVEALETLVGWAEEHRDFCKRNGVKPAIDAWRTKHGRRALTKARSEMGGGDG